MVNNNMKPLKELLDSARTIDGFPKGKDMNILKYSDPPSYTMCPNPYLRIFVEENGTIYDPEHDNYDKTPYMEDVIEKRSGPIYNAHTYYTKVPHKAIMKYIQHYTSKGDLVLDGFCGSGMTGVAAQLLDRKCILVDLAPAATFISHGYNHPVDPDILVSKASQLLKEVREECSWLYKTRHVKNAINSRDGSHLVMETAESHGEINYVVWSDVFICPSCGNELVFFDLAVSMENSAIETLMKCPQCDSSSEKRDCSRVIETHFDEIIGKEVSMARQVPVVINYAVGKETFFKKPDEEDLQLLAEIQAKEIPHHIPILKIYEGINTSQPLKSHKLTHFHQFFKKRILWVISCFWEKVQTITNPSHIYFLLTSYINTHATIMTNIYVRDKKFVLTNKSPNNLSIPSLGVEKNFLKGIRSKIKPISNIYRTIKPNGNVIISTNSTTQLDLPDNCVDYIFIDPPFGENIMYSELSIFWEAWFGVFTNNALEAIMNKSQGKSIKEYENLMTRTYSEMHRVLKPNRWITTEFHNSKASVWNSIQNSITRAGFIIAQVAILDKKQKTFKQVTTPRAVYNDLIINAYKPKWEFGSSFIKNAGKNMELEFITQQLEHLPTDQNMERTENMLYSRMLAYYMENGFKINQDASQFHELLSKNFKFIDGYWFNYSIFNDGES